MKTTKTPTQRVWLLYTEGEVDHELHSVYSDLGGAQARAAEIQYGAFPDDPEEDRGIDWLPAQDSPGTLNGWGTGCNAQDWPTFIIKERAVL